MCSRLCMVNGVSDEKIAFAWRESANDSSDRVNIWRTRLFDIELFFYENIIFFDLEFLVYFPLSARRTVYDQ